ncbi:sodium/potassium/calcium exchanger 5 [Halictus rubicundus]|uniref:sodium/potassium/calcium exchanger 5 n=1 Tax=Halictus rubicundus TaxID=77578 RepID=UPI004036257A
MIEKFLRQPDKLRPTIASTMVKQIIPTHGYGRWEGINPSQLDPVLVLREMNGSRLYVCCAWIVVLAVWFPIVSADLSNDVEQPIETTTAKQCGHIDDDDSDDFPEDLFTDEQRRQGAIVLHVFLGFYCFLITAFVCHNYLLPSLDRICVKMNISTDVAGATFLAMASSLPEMFVNVVGTFLTKSDLGVSTVVGSAVFDTFATPAVGALAALHAVPLQWRVLTRDCAMYIISVGTLVIVIWDGIIVWYEATVLLVVLLAYMILLFSGKFLVRSCSGATSTSTVKLSSVAENMPTEGSYQPRSIEISNGNGVLWVKETKDQKDQKDRRDQKAEKSAASDPESLATEQMSDDHEELENIFLWPREKSVPSKFWFLLVWPLKFLLFATIPDPRRERFSSWYPLTFFMCVVWIAISSYLVSWMVTLIGSTVGIPDSVMGFTFLAAGGNMPEMSSIVILARQGDGNMAMSNTLGANILDILLCLGLPWLIKCLMTGKDVEVKSDAMSYSILSIIGCIIVLYAVIAVFRFELNKKVGVICILLYTIFIVFSILAEMNVFTVANSSYCV